MTRKHLIPALLLAGVAAAPPAHAATLQASCSFTGVLDTTSNTITFVLSGDAEANLATSVTLTCELTNGNGSTVVATTTQTCPGTACATATVSSPQPVVQVGVCTTASAVLVGGGTTSTGRQCHFPT